MKTITLSLLACATLALAQPKRVLLDAHNCYPYDAFGADRMDRALKLNIPVAIEQDLAWDPDKKKSFVSHEKIILRGAPFLRFQFWERIRPVAENALESGANKDQWPLITLNLDFKTLEPEHARDVLALLLEYKDWLTSAPKSDTPAPLDVKPVLVLVGDSDVLEQVFNQGERIYAFGAAKLSNPAPATPVKTMLKDKATNYRRWVNIPWPIIEAGGQKAAGAWTPAENARLTGFAQHAHDLGYWMRVYTLNGYDPRVNFGWSDGYNLGNIQAAQTRWEAARVAGVDFIATDQYEQLAAWLKSPGKVDAAKVGGPATVYTPPPPKPAPARKPAPPAKK